MWHCSCSKNDTDVQSIYSMTSYGFWRHWKLQTFRLRGIDWNESFDKLREEKKNKHQLNRPYSSARNVINNQQIRTHASTPIAQTIRADQHLFTVLSSWTSKNKLNTYWDQSISMIWIWRLYLIGTNLRKWPTFNMGIFTETSFIHWEIRIENYSLRWPATLMALHCTRVVNSRCGRSLRASTSCDDQYDSTWKTWSVSKYLE